MTRSRVRDSIAVLAIVAFLVALVGAGVPEASQTAGWGDWWRSVEEQRLDRIEQMVDCGVKVLYQNGHGSGVLFVRGEEVYVITAAHVIVDRNSRGGPFGFLPQAMIPDIVQTEKTYGTRPIWIHRHRQSVDVYATDVYIAEIVAVDAHADAAILRVKNVTPENFPGLDGGAVFDLRNNKLLRRGMKTIHVGNFHDSIEAVTEGVIANPQQPLEHGSGPLPEFRVIQVTNMIAPGSSGGGMYLEGNGKCIGIVVRTTWMPGDSLVIPIYQIDQWLNGVSEELAVLLEQPE